MSRPRAPDGPPEVVSEHGSASYLRESFPAPGGEIVVLRVGGRVDLDTHPMLVQMLISALRGSPRHLVVDLSGVTFCRVQELTLLLGIGADAAANGIGYSVSGVPASLNRADKFLWGGGQPVHHRCAATAVTAIRAGQLASGGQRHAEGSARPAGHAPTAADGRPRLEIARIERQ